LEQPARTTQRAQVATLVVLIAACLGASCVCDRQRKSQTAAIAELRRAVAERDRAIAELQRSCCVPCNQTLPALNCLPSLCARTPRGLCCTRD
jgi:hypothetical protein